MPGLSGGLEAGVADGYVEFANQDVLSGRLKARMKPFF